MGFFDLFLPKKNAIPQAPPSTALPRTDERAFSLTWLRTSLHAGRTACHSRRQLLPFLC